MIVRVCAGTSSFAIPLVVDHPGARSVFVSGRSETNGTLTCSVFTFTFDRIAVPGPAAQTWTRNGASQRRTFAGVHVPAGGTGTVLCTLSGNNSSRPERDRLPALKARPPRRR